MWQNIFFKHKHVYLIIFLCILSFYLLAFEKGRSLLFSTLVDFFSPLQKITSSASLGVVNIFTSVSDYVNLKSENEKLKEGINLLRTKSQEFEETAEENIRLQKLLSFKKESNYKMLVVSVIGHEPTNLFHGCLIDRGIEDGVRKNMIVITDEGVVGKIVFAMAKVSKVMFLIDPNHSISALDQRTRSFGIVTGTGKSYCLMKYLSIDDEVAVGDKVISAGEGGIYPKGIPIGRISNLTRSADGSSWYIEVQPYSKFSKIEEAFVIIPN